MKHLLTFLLFCTFVFSGTLTLQEHYEFDDTTIYASDFFPEVEDDFVVITLPENLDHFNISTKKILTAFAKHGITLSNTAYGIIHFSRMSTFNSEPLKTYLKTYYLKHYPFLEIHTITIKAKNRLDRLPKEYRYVLKKQAFKYPKGTLMLISDKKRYFFSFSIDASYKQFYAKSTLLRSTPITWQNIQEKSTPFLHTIAPRLTHDAIGKVVAKRYIKQGNPIHQKDVILIPLVKKHAIVNVKLIEGNILINFSATALKDGALGDIIPIQKSDKTRLKVKVVGPNKVVIE